MSVFKDKKKLAHYVVIKRLRYSSIQVTYEFKRKLDKVKHPWESYQDVIGRYIFG